MPRGSPAATAAGSTTSSCSARRPAPDADSRNFVLCPGKAYDRSPCGTGTSAKLAALHAKGKLRPGERLRQESVVGSLFTAWFDVEGDVVIPHIEGRAYITGRATLLFDPDDPFRCGLG